MWWKNLLLRYAHFLKWYSSVPRMVWLFWLTWAMPLEAWHFLDVYYTFYTVMVLTLFICGINGGDYKLMIVNLYSTLMVALVHYARFTVHANLILWAFPFSFFLFSMIMKKTRHIQPAILIKVIVNLAVAVISFVLANFTGFNRENDSIRYKNNPSAPETDIYWIFHSLWHLFSQIAIFYLLDSSSELPQVRKRD